MARGSAAAKYKGLNHPSSAARTHLGDRSGPGSEAVTQSSEDCPDFPWSLQLPESPNPAEQGGESWALPVQGWECDIWSQGWGAAVSDLRSTFPAYAWWRCPESREATG